MRQMKIKKKGVDWGILTGAILVLIILGILLFIIPQRLLAGGKNVDYLGSCKNQGGTCKVNCGPDETGFFKSGCPFDTNGNGKIDDNEKGDYCCIPK